MTMSAFKGRLLCGTALQAVALLVFGQAAAQPAPGARPMGGQVVGGAASIGQTAAQTTVNQASQRAAIDWRSFDVGRDHTVQFNQPGATAIVLNRVTGPDPSAIAGRIQANGQVVITNQSGVTFHRGAQVDTAGLVVSAAGISTQNFMAGRMVFDQAPRPDAAVSNAGDITVKQAGLAALVAPRVANSGTIRAPMGKVVLAGAETHTVDLYGDGLLSIDVTRQVRTTPRGADGKPITALVTNTGTVIADGGTVLLTAAAADGIVQTLVEAGGRIQANNAGGRTGRIAVAGVGGDIRIEGRVAADGGASGSVPSQGGGGSVAVGGGMAGSVYVAPTARISANGRGTGSGGSVTLLSRQQTTLAGRVAAKGGKQGGNGGAVEVSGTTVGITGRITTAAPAGRVGTILIDPTDVVIANDGRPNAITSASIEAMSGTITIQATNSVVAAASVTLTSPSVGSFTLDAGNFVRVDPGVTLTAPHNLIFRAGAGGVSMLGSAISTSTGVNTNEGIQFFTPGAVTQGAASTLSGPSLGGTVGSAALDSRLNQFASIGGGTFFPQSLTATAGDIGVVNRVALTVGSPSPGGGIQVPTGRQVTLTTDGITLVPGTQFGGPPQPFAISAPGGSVAIRPFTAGTPLELTAGAKTAGSLSLTNADLGTIRAGALTFGAATAGAATISPGTTGAVTFPATLPRLNLLSGGAVTQGGQLTVGTLSGQAASLTLGNTGNAVPVLDGFVATAGDVFFHTGQSLLVSAPVQGANVDLSSAGLPTDQMTLAANVTGARVRLDSTTGSGPGNPIDQTAGIITAQTLTGAGGNVTLAQPNQVQSLGPFAAGSFLQLVTVPSLSLAGTVSAGALVLQSGGAITQAPGSALQVGSLGGQAASATFDSAANQVARLSTFTTTAGDFALTTQLVRGTPLSIAGTNAVASGRSATITADQVAFDQDLSSLTATGGRIAFAPLTPGRGIELTATGATPTPGTLSIQQDGISRLTAGTVQLGTATTGPIAIGQAGNAIDFTGHAATLDLRSAGAVTEAGTLTVGTLTGVTGSAALNGANAIGTLGAFSTTGALSLRDGTALAVTGPVTAGTSIDVATTRGLTLAGTVTAPSVILAAGTPGIQQVSGIVTGTNTLDLNTPGPITQTGGTVATALLTGSAGSVSLPSTGNQVASIGPFTTTGNFLLTDGRTLTVVAPVDPGDVTLNVTGDLVLKSSVTANTLTLNVSGAVTEVTGPSTSGAVFATTLRGQSGSVRLDLTNQVGTVAGFSSTGGFLLYDSTPLTVAGPAVDQTGITLRSTGPMTLSGTVSAPDVTLITQNVRGQLLAPITQTGGTVSAPGTLTLTSADAIQQNAGTIVAGTVTGQSGAATSLTSAGNQVTRLGPFASVGGFALTDGVALTQSGALTDTLRIALNDPAGLALTGTLNAPSVDLRGGAVTQPGGAITTTTLTGAVASATLDRPNAITNLGAFTSIGDASLSDGVTLNVTGAASVGSGRTLALTADQIALQPGGSLAAPAGTVALAPLTAGAPFSLGSFVPGGTVSAVTADTLRVGSASAGTVSIGGSFNLTGVTTLDLRSGADIVEAPFASLNVGRLTGAARSAALGGGNTIATLGPFTTTTGFTLGDSAALVVTGPVRDGASIQIAASGPITVQGDVSAPSVVLNTPGALTQTAGAVTAGTLGGSTGSTSLPSAGNQVGTLSATAGTSILLKDSTGLIVTSPTGGASATLDVAGDILFQSFYNAQLLNLTATGRITAGATGGVVAGTLQGQAGSIVLNGSRVGQLNGFNAPGGVTLASTVPLSVTGNVTGSTIGLSSSGPLTIGANLTGGTVALSASAAPGTTAPGTITQAAGFIAGTTQVSLNATDTIAQTGGGIITPLLTGSAGSDTTLTAPANGIGALGTFTSPGTLRLVDGQALALTGTVTAYTLDLSAAGGITQPSGQIVANTLQGRGGGAVGLDRPGNTIDNLGAFAASGDLTLIDSRPLAVTGASSAGSGRTLSVAAPSIAIQPGGGLSAPGGTVALQPNTPGTQFTLSSFVPAGTVAAITADTLQVGAPTSGTITVAGPFALPGVATLSLLSGAGLIEAPGASLSVGRLTGQAASATLDGANQVGTLGPFTTTGGFSFTNAQPLTVGGTVQDGTRVRVRVDGALTLAADIGAPLLDLTSTGAITQTAGAVRTGALTGSGQSVSFPSAGNRIASLGSFQSDAFTLTDRQALTIAGRVVYGAGAFTVSGDLVINGALAASGAGTTLSVTGAVTEGPGGQVTGALLSGQAQTIFLDQNNTLVTVQGLTARDQLSISNAAPLTVNGVTGGSAVALSSAGPLTVTGDVRAPFVVLAAAQGAGTSGVGSITQTGGTVAAGLLSLRASDVIVQSGGAVSGFLSGTAGGAVRLTSDGNRIATLNSFSAASFALSNGQGLTVQGPVQAGSIALVAPAITLSGGSLAGGPITLQGGTITQTGTTSIAAPTLTISGGPMVFANLIAPQTAVTLNLGGSKASGTVNLGSLLVVGSGGQADLFGVVASRTGFDAAIASRINPRFDPAYQVNNCAIASITCTAVPPPPPPPPTATPNPVAPPVTVRVFVLNRLFPQSFLVQGFLRPDLFTADLVTLAVARDPTDPSIVLPNISDRDY